MNKKCKYLFMLTLMSCNIASVSAVTRQCITCGGTKGIPAALATFSRNGINLIQILVPVVIIFVGIIGYFKAVISGDDKIMKEATNSFIKKLITGIVILLVVTIVKMLFGIIGNKIKDNDNPIACLDCFTNSESSCGVKNCPTRVSGTKPSNGKSNTNSSSSGSGSSSCSSYGVSNCAANGCKWNGSMCVDKGGSSSSSSSGGSTSCSSYGVSNCASNGCKWNGSMCVDKG